MFAKLGAFIKVLRVGNEVANPDMWMKRQANGNKIGLLILALVGLAKVYGYELPMDETQALIVGGAIASLWNILFGIATSYQQGMLPSQPSSVQEQDTKQLGNQADGNEVHQREEVKVVEPPVQKETMSPNPLPDKNRLGDQLDKDIYIG